MKFKKKNDNVMRLCHANQGFIHMILPHYEG